MISFREAVEKYKALHGGSFRVISPQQKREIHKLQQTKPKHCRWCAGKLTGRKQSWCGQSCVDEYLIMCGDTRLIREKLWERDQGTCQACGLDVSRFIEDIGNSNPDNHEILYRKLQDYLNLPDYPRTLEALTRAYHKATTHHLWEAHHRIPVHQGGGMCGLENYTLLCVKCHKAFHARRVKF